MIARFAVATIAIGLVLLAGGIFLSEGYSAKQGFLASLPKMKVRLAGDKRHAQFSQVLRTEAKGDSADEGVLFQVPASYAVGMRDAELSQVAQAFDAQRLGPPKSGYVYSFSGWAVERGISLPLGPLLAVGSFLVIVGAVVVVSAYTWNHARKEGPSSATGDVPPLDSHQPMGPETKTPVKQSGLRFVLHLWGGVCLKAAADVSGLVVVRGASDVESASRAATAAALITVLLILVGYFISHRLVAALDTASFAPKFRTTIMILLPIAYFVGAILIGGVAGLFAGNG